MTSDTLEPMPTVDVHAEVPPPLFVQSRPKRRRPRPPTPEQECARLRRRLVELEGHSRELAHLREVAGRKLPTIAFRRVAPDFLLAIRVDVDRLARETTPDRLAAILSGILALIIGAARLGVDDA